MRCPNCGKSICTCSDAEIGAAFRRKQEQEEEQRCREREPKMWTLERKPGEIPDPEDGPWFGAGHAALEEITRCLSRSRSSGAETR